MMEEGGGGGGRKWRREEEDGTRGPILAAIFVTSFKLNRPLYYSQEYLAYARYRIGKRLEISLG